MSTEQFQAARKAHIPGRRRGRDQLSGRVRCGICQRVVSVDYNERGQALFRCWHRCRGCRLPGRSVNGLHRAAVLRLRVLANDAELQEAIRGELAHRLPANAGPSTSKHRRTSTASLNGELAKLLKLYYSDHITAETFAKEEARIISQLRALETEEIEVIAEIARRDELSDRFEKLAQFLRTLDVDAVWEEGTQAERRRYLSRS